MECLRYYELSEILVYTTYLTTSGIKISEINHFMFGCNTALHKIKMYSFYGHNKGYLRVIYSE